MDLWDLTRLMVRRWYFSVPMLLVTVSAALATGLSVEPDYSATGHLQLIPPKAIPEDAAKAGRPNNPWVSLGIDGIGQAGLIKVQDQSVLESLHRAGYSDTFTVTMNGPSTILEIEAVGNSPQQATATVRRVIALLNQYVRDEQQRFQVSSQDKITTLTLDDGANVKTVNSTVRRALVVVAGIGLLITAAGTIAFDALARLLARGRVARTAPPAPRTQDEQDPRDELARGVAEPAPLAQRINGHADARELAGAPEPGKAERGRAGHAGH